MRVRFTAQADADIVDCYLYGFETFGAAQAERYESGLRRAIEIIAENPHLAAERPEYTPPVRIHHHGKHYVVYVVADDHVLIVRVLRDAMDLTRHLQRSDLNRNI